MFLVLETLSTFISDIQRISFELIADLNLSQILLSNKRVNVRWLMRVEKWSFEISFRFISLLNVTLVQLFQSFDISKWGKPLHSFLDVLCFLEYLGFTFWRYPVQVSSNVRGVIPLRLKSLILSLLEFSSSQEVVIVSLIIRCKAHVFHSSWVGIDISIPACSIWPIL